MTEQFRKVEPLKSLDGDEARKPNAWVWPEGNLNIIACGLTVPEARALRDWLNRALPEDHP